ncbi:MAG: hypothetical protein V5A27_00225 [Halapricum sp.]
MNPDLQSVLVQKLLGDVPITHRTPIRLEHDVRTIDRKDLHGYRELFAPVFGIHDTHIPLEDPFVTTEIDILVFFVFVLDVLERVAYSPVRLPLTEVNERT